MELKGKSLGTLIRSSLSVDQKAALNNVYHNLLAGYARLRNGQPSSPLLGYQRDGYKDTFSVGVMHRTNYYYGIEPMLLGYSDYDRRLKSTIEHGLYVGPFVNRHETNNSGLPAVITFGPRRAEAIRAVCDVPILQIGPYIQYATPFIDGEEPTRLKRELGKVMLVFPSHSIETTGVEFDVGHFIRLAEELARKNSADTILYCLYFNDINNGMARQFEDHGCTVVSAGHRSDPTFLSRLRSLIELSDITASNSVGTHIGYCAALGKPHSLISMDVEREEASLLTYDYDYQSDYKKAVKREEDFIASAFVGSQSEYAEDVLHRYWGLGLQRSPEDLKGIFCEFDKVYREMKLNNLSAREAMRRVSPETLSMLDADE